MEPRGGGGGGGGPGDGGRTLGGGDPSRQHRHLSNDEMRHRRLAALQQQQQQSPPSPAPAMTPPPPPSSVATADRDAGRSQQLQSPASAESNSPVVGAGEVEDEGAPGGKPSPGADSNSSSAATATTTEGGGSGTAGGGGSSTDTAVSAATTETTAATAQSASSSSPSSTPGAPVASAAFNAVPLPPPPSLLPVLPAPIATASPPTIAASVAAPPPPSSYSSPSYSCEVSDFCDVPKFHSIMWDEGTTVDSDKRRWVSQGIALRSEVQHDVDGAWFRRQQQQQAAAAAGNHHDAGACVDRMQRESLLSWGLVQHHGGPCGVLAAIQAELLRLLLFDRGGSGSGNGNPEEEGGGESSSPVAASAHPSGLSWTPLSRALAIVLARAAVTPSAAAAPASSPAAGSVDATAKTPAMTKPSAPAVVRLVLPRHRTALTWEDLEPWSLLSSSSSHSHSHDPRLAVYTIRSHSSASPASASASASPVAVGDSCMPDAPATTDTINTTKRQKIHNDNNNSISETVGAQQQDEGEKLAGLQLVEEDEEEDDRGVEALALAVSHFLQTPFPIVNNSSSRIDGKASSSIGTNNQSQPQLQPQHRPLDCFFQPGGVLLLVLSLVATRGFDVVRSEFDDPANSKLTAQFGHCSQELINLLLTGQAVSNVFDNTMKLDGEITCRGITMRPNVGYLTQLESLRYCAVGDYYKSPKYPIWVVGSTSHFTVLFGERSALYESPSDQLLERCRRAFQKVEGASENGFIETAQLKSVYQTLNLEVTKSSSNSNSSEDEILQMLTASIEVQGAGIILWDDFWKVTSRLLTGASVETILQQDDDDLPPLIPSDPGAHNESPTAASDANDAAPSVLLVHGPSLPPQQHYFGGAGHQQSSTLVSAHADPADDVRIETDEEMARRLTKEYEEEFRRQNPQQSNNTGMSALSAVARAASPMDVDYTPHYSGSGNDNNAPLSDEELARKLQAEWDAELASGSGGGGGEGSSVAAVDGSDSPPPLLLMDRPYGAPTPPPTVNLMDEDDEEDAKKPAAVTSAAQEAPQPAVAATATTPPKQEFEQYGPTFSLYHYNGLRGGILTPFRVTRLTAEEAVGASISLNRSTSTGIKSGDLEDVVQTKWPSCQVDWLGQTPPFID